MSEEQNNNKEEQKIKRGKNFDVFISYRRSDGTVKAKALDLAFSMDDCRTFFDFKSLGTGAFDKRLENAVLDAPIFIMVLTPDYFKRCVKGGETADGKTVFEPDEDDWVRKEIELALANSKKIIPINYDKVLDNIPDYLDEDLKKGLGVHQFVNLYGDNTFDDTVKGIFDREIRPFIGATPKPENKVNVRVKADADCELIDNDEVIATIQQGKTAQLFFERGEYELIARSTAFPHIYEVIERTFDDVSYHYLVRVELAERILDYRDKIIHPTIKCAIPPKEEEKEAEARKQIEQAVRRLVQNLTAHPKTLTGHSNKVLSVSWSPDGKYLASSSLDRTVKVWDANSGQKLKTLKGHSGFASSVCWSPNGKYLASGAGYKTVIIWDANSGEELKTLEGHSWSVKSVCWSPDGKYLASGSADDTVIIWDANSGQKLKSLEGHSDHVESVSWSPDGKYLASGSWDETVRIWDAKSGGCIQTLEGHSRSVYSVCWSPDGNYLASGSADETLIIWDAKSGEKLKTLKGHSNGVFSVCWSPDGKYLASGSVDETVIIWDAESGESLKTLEGHSWSVLSVCWSPDGKYLASGSWDKTVKIWGAD